MGPGPEVRVQGQRDGFRTRGTGSGPEVKVQVQDQRDQICEHSRTFRSTISLKPRQTEAVLQGFKGHQLHDVLSSPGSADLTADVDFSYLRRMAGEGVACLGPVTQRTFLKNMGIDSRLQVLLRNCSDASTRKQLTSSYDMLTNPARMGGRFLFLSLLHRSRLATPTKAQGLKLERRDPAQLPVAGFTELRLS